MDGVGSAGGSWGGIIVLGSNAARGECERRAWSCAGTPNGGPIPEDGAGDIIVVVALTWPFVRGTDVLLQLIKLGCEVVHALIADGTMRTGQ